MGYKLDEHSSLLVCPFTPLILKGAQMVKREKHRRIDSKNYHAIPTGTSSYDCNVNYKLLKYYLKC